MAFEYLQLDLETISSPAGRKAVETAYHHMIHCGAPAKPHAETEKEAYRVKLRRRLNNSGLAEALAAGPGVLPDITDHIAFPWRAWHRLFLPRDVAAMTKHVATYLDWYLSPLKLHGVLPGSPWFLSAAITILGLGLAEMASSALFGGFSALRLLIFLGVFGLIQSLNRPAAISEEQRLAAVEFYQYLVRIYQDPAEPRGAALEAADLTEPAADESGKGSELSPEQAPAGVVSALERAAR